MPKGNPRGYKTGRDHPAVGSVPQGGAGRSPYGRDYPHTGKPPTGGTVPTGPGGRDHPAVKGTEIPKMSDPFGRSKR